MMNKSFALFKKDTPKPNCFICRSGVRPFEQARSVFAALPDVPEDVKVKMEGVVSQPVKAEAEVDILQLCNTIALEVVGLGEHILGILIYCSCQPQEIVSTEQPVGMV